MPRTFPFTGVSLSIPVLLLCVTGSNIILVLMFVWHVFMHEYSQNCNHIYASPFVLLPLFYSVCVFLCDCWDAGKSEAQAASWLDPPRPLRSVLNPHQSLFGWVGLGGCCLLTVQLERAHRAHIKNHCLHHCDVVVWTRRALFILIRWCLN